MKLAALSGRLSGALVALTLCLTADARERMQELRQLIARLGVRLERVDPLARPRGTRKVEELVLEETLEPVLEAWGGEIAEAEVELVRSFRAGASVVGNAEALQQAVAALIDNGLHWLRQRKKDRRLLVAVGYQGDRPELYVGNNGPTIPIKAVRHIFEPGFSLSENAGLGLPLARDLLGSVGWIIELSQNERGNVRFGLRPGS